jgi:hypothetical protein
MAEKKATPPKKAATYTTAGVHYEVNAGALEVDGYGPVACGEHNSTGGIFDTTTEPGQAPGFDPSCDACKAQADVIGEFARRDTTRV